MEEFLDHDFTKQLMVDSYLRSVIGDYMLGRVPDEKNWEAILRNPSAIGGIDVKESDWVCYRSE
jgi:hypothetical protein